MRILLRKVAANYEVALWILARRQPRETLQTVPFDAEPRAKAARTDDQQRRAAHISGALQIQKGLEAFLDLHFVLLREYLIVFCQHLIYSKL